MSKVFKPNKSSKEVIGVIVKELEQSQDYLCDREDVVNSFLYVFADALYDDVVPFGPHFMDDVAMYFSDSILNFDIETLDSGFSKRVISEWNKIQKLRPDLNEYLLEEYAGFIYEVSKCFLKNNEC